MDSTTELAPNICRYCGEVSGNTRVSSPHLAKHRRNGDPLVASVEVLEDPGFNLWRYRIITPFGWIAGSWMNKSGLPNSAKAATFQTREIAVSHAEKFAAYLDGVNTAAGQVGQIAALEAVETGSEMVPASKATVPSTDVLIGAITKFLPPTIDMKHVGRIVAWAEETQAMIKAVNR